MTTSPRRSEEIPLLNRTPPRPSQIPNRIANGVAIGGGVVAFLANCYLVYRTLPNGTLERVLTMVATAGGAVCTCLYCIKLVQSLKSRHVEPATAAMNAASQETHGIALKEIIAQLDEISPTHPDAASQNPLESILQKIQQLKMQLEHPADCKDCAQYKAELEGFQKKLTELETKLFSMTASLPKSPAPGQPATPVSPQLSEDLTSLLGEINGLNRQVQRAATSTPLTRTPAQTPTTSPYKASPSPAGRPKQIPPFVINEPTPDNV